MRRLRFNSIVVGLVILFLVCSSKRSYASSITTSIINPSSSYNENSEITVHSVLDISSSNGTVYYLGGAFRRGTGNYCGLTSVDGSWIKYGADGNKFFKITIQDNKWEGDIKVKLDNGDSSCKDSGEYKLKIKRYTDNSETFDDQTELTLNFTLPSPSPTPTPTNTPAPTQTPTPTTKPSSTPTPTPTSSPTASPKVTNTPTPKITGDPRTREGGSESALMQTQTDTEPTQGILGANASFANSQSEIPTTTAQNYNWGALFIVMGVVLVTGSCGILLYNNYRKNKAEGIEAAP